MFRDQTRCSTRYASHGSSRDTAFSSPLTRGSRLLRPKLAEAIRGCVMLCDARPKISEQPGEARAGAALLEGVDRQPLTYQCVAAQPRRPQHSLAECEYLSKSSTCVHVTPMWAEAPFPRRYP